LSGPEETARITVAAKGANAKLAVHLPLLLAGTPDHPPAGPQDIQAYYAGLVAKAANMTLKVATASDLVVIEAEPHPAKATAEAVAS
jgi:histidine phosphotransferase ChpT